MKLQHVLATAGCRALSVLCLAARYLRSGIHNETCFQRALAWGGVSVFQPRPGDISTRPLSSSSGERKKK